jgi:Mn-dependent DtxR family transcriptional regulator
MGDLRASQIVVLEAATTNGLTPQGLAARIGTTERSASERLRRLEALGYLEVQWNAYWLTVAGQSALANARPHPQGKGS